MRGVPRQCAVTSVTICALVAWRTRGHSDGQVTLLHECNVQKGDTAVLITQQTAERT